MFRFYDLIHYVNLQILYIYFSRKFKLLQFIYFDSNLELIVSSIQIFFLTPEITRYVTKFEEKKLRENFRSINRPNRFIDLAMQIISRSVEKMVRRITWGIPNSGDYFSLRDETKKTAKRECISRGTSATV